MKTLKPLFLIVPIFLFSSCGILKDVFVNNYDGAGCFNKLLNYQEGICTPADSLNLKEGFDAVVFVHLKILYSNNQKIKPDEIRGYPELFFNLTDEFINSDAVIKEDVRRRGILARWFKYYVNGSWIDQNNNIEKHFDSYSVFEAKSKMNVVNIASLYLRFGGESWIKILIDKNFKIEPDKINYLGTLSISLHKTDEYSGKVISPAYTKYMSETKEGYLYNVDVNLKYNENDYWKDLKYIEENFPNIYNDYKNSIVYFQWD